MMLSGVTLAGCSLCQSSSLSQAGIPSQKLSQEGIPSQKCHLALPSGSLGPLLLSCHSRPLWSGTGREKGLTGKLQVEEVGKELEMGDVETGRTRRRSPVAIRAVNQGNK